MAKKDTGITSDENKEVNNGQPVPTENVVQDATTEKETSLEEQTNQEEKKEELPQGGVDQQSENTSNDQQQVTEKQEQPDTTEEDAEQHKVTLLFIITRKINVLAELLKPLVLVKGGVVQHTGSVLPDFESEYVKQTLSSLAEAAEWAKLLIKCYDENFLPNPNHVDNKELLFPQEALDTFDSIINGDRSSAAYNFAFLVKEECLNKLAEIDTSNKGVEAAIFRINLFTQLYRVFFLLGFEETRANEYKEFFNSLTPEPGGSQE